MRTRRTVEEKEMIKLFPQLLKAVVRDGSFSARSTITTPNNEDVTVIVIKLNKDAATSLIDHLNSEHTLYTL